VPPSHWSETVEEARDPAAARRLGFCDGELGLGGGRRGVGFAWCGRSEHVSGRGGELGAAARRVSVVGSEGDCCLLVTVAQSRLH
jgi:hypothetical protein